VARWEWAVNGKKRSDGEVIFDRGEGEAAAPIFEFRATLTSKSVQNRNLNRAPKLNPPFPPSRGSRSKIQTSTVQGSFVGAWNWERSWTWGSELEAFWNCYDLRPKCCDLCCDFNRKNHSVLPTLLRRCDLQGATPYPSSSSSSSSSILDSVSGLFHSCNSCHSRITEQ